ncbi:uncharacterized protein K452DRAFT_235268 [Aplosporella prunicola CBS 121167]|uniref:Uncharacterized protein n=1 Tax=Aplosporella prunicola CBS 121167 TaxID=1176127 RepID=A0A6A6B2C5_9PEZI|nr:uncharacterized protein K452DRAFT_235268 [Aplosporella prunicola CBS 121167]KAF2137748.1 hypothetical protein K452DRAFT_235268 [Aplosporella prunicola CBS 121167]
MSPPIINFPSLQPALICKVNVGAGHVVGPKHSGSTLFHFETPTGTLETVEGFEPKFNADVVFGADWLTFDDDKKHARINLKAVAVEITFFSSTKDDKAIDFGYQGIISLNEEVQSIFNMAPTSKSVPFGFSSTLSRRMQTGAHTFQSGGDGLRELENMTFIGNGRMLVNEETRVITVESRISRVVPATGFD